MSETLEKRVQKLEDTIEIYHLQSRYNFYLSMYLGEKAVDELFSEHPEVSNVINGAKWVGRESIKRMFLSLDKVHKDMPGRMGSIMAIEPLITFSEEGTMADGQWFGLGPSVLPVKNSEEDPEHLEALWMFGRYDCAYIKEKGVWKIFRLGWNMHFMSPPNEGWVDSPRPHYVRPFVKEKGAEPDTPSTFRYVYKPEGPNTYGPPPPELKKK